MRGYLAFCLAISAILLAGCSSSIDPVKAAYADGNAVGQDYADTFQGAFGPSSQQSQEYCDGALSHGNAHGKPTAWVAGCVAGTTRFFDPAYR